MDGEPRPVTAAIEGGAWTPGPRALLLGTLAFVVAVVATPPDAWRLLAVEGLALAFVVGLAGVEPGAIARRLLTFAPLLLFLGWMVGQTHPARATLGTTGVAAALVARNVMAITALLTLAERVPFPRLLHTLQALGVPAVLVATLHFMYRYLHVLVAERDRMLLARRARSFRRSGRPDWTRLGGLLGVLFLRALERGERVHSAMLARGWDGILRTLDDPAPGPAARPASSPTAMRAR